MHGYLSFIDVKQLAMTTHIDCGHLNTLSGSSSVFICCRRSKLDAISSNDSPLYRSDAAYLVP